MTVHQTLVDILAVRARRRPAVPARTAGDWLRRCGGRVLTLGLIPVVVASATGMVADVSVRAETVQKAGARLPDRGVSCRGTRGIQIVEFGAAGGELTIMLPDDMAAGDAVSGIAWADHGAPLRRESAPARIAGWSLAVGDDVSRLTDGVVAFRIPPAADHVTLHVRDAGGKVVATADVPVRAAEVAAQGPALPASCPKRSLFTLRGHFDGDLRNTEVLIAGERLRPWVESPRRIVLIGPQAVEGRAFLALTDGGWSASEMTSVVGVSVRPRSVAVTRGQTVPVTVTVTGLAGAEPGQPVTIDLDHWPESAPGTWTSWSVDPAQAVDGSVTRTVPVIASADGTLRAFAWLRNDASPKAAAPH